MCAAGRRITSFVMASAGSSAGLNCTSPALASNAKAAAANRYVMVAPTVAAARPYQTRRTDSLLFKINYFALDLANFANV